MRTLFVSILSFIAGVILTGLLGLKFAIGLSYEASISQLTDNVAYYENIEQGKPELVQDAIVHSLAWSISKAEDAKDSIWISPQKDDHLVIAKAKQLQTSLQGH